MSDSDRVLLTDHATGEHDQVRWAEHSPFGWTLYAGYVHNGRPVHYPFAHSTIDLTDGEAWAFVRLVIENTQLREAVAAELGAIPPVKELIVAARGAADTLLDEHFSASYDEAHRSRNVAWQSLMPVAWQEITAALAAFEEDDGGDEG